MQPLFVSIEFARDLEQAECDLLTGCCGAIASQREGIVVLPFAGGVAAFAGDDTPLNKIAGLGFEGLPTDQEMDRAEAIYFDRGARAQVEVCCMADIELSAMLTKRGYQVAGYENVLVRPLDREVETGASEITVEHSEELPDWLDAVVEGFLNPDAQGIAPPDEFNREALRKVIVDMDSHPQLHRYSALIDGQIVGGASISIGKRFAQLCGASTLPEFRRRGAQTALLHQRLIDSAKAGCEYAAVATLPGSKSQMNVQKHGFEHAYTKAIFVRQSS